MRIGLLADSHGNHELVARCTSFLVAQCGAERLFFLGGRYRDLDPALAEIEREGLPPPQVTRVSAAGDPEHPSAPIREIEMIGTLLACLVHDKSTLTKDEIGNVSMIFHGNSREAALVKIGTRLFITPGALALPGAPPWAGTFGLVVVGPNAVQLVIYRATDMGEKKRETVRLDKRTIFRAT